IRRFFPKGADFSKVSLRRINAAAAWINNYPRRKLGGLSANFFATRCRLDN
ncbi:MAG: IS30 family transposase, partial [Oscillospiraceae bacterium]|nr:IS30 family transposase [Oscillospiraceae bacterium]